MPLINISLKDLNEVVGKKLKIEDFENISENMKIGIEKSEGDNITLEIKDSNRPDLLSVEGIAREMRGILGKEEGLKRYKINESDFVVKKDWRPIKIRPHIVCAVVKNIRLNDYGIKQIIQLQEKLCEGFGRKRKEAAIGIYDFDKIKWPICYTTTKPDGLRYIPLDMDVALTPKEILEQHEKGKEYASLLAGAKEYPILLDKMNNVLSMPPIINSNYSGKVTDKTKNLFIEVTGFSEERIMQTLNIVVAALADRGGEIYKVRVGKNNYPDFTEKKKKFSIDDVKELLGIELKPKEIVGLLEKARYSAKLLKGNMIEVTIPFYRADILHSVDIIEDIAIIYGYNNIKVEEPRVFSEGSLLNSTKLSNKIATTLIGLGFQETASFVTSNKDDQFKKMGIPVEEVIEIENPVSQTYSCLRKWLLPSLMEVLSQNKANQYPQKIFETGEVCRPNNVAETKSENVQKLAIAICGETVGFTEIKQTLDYLSKSLKFDYVLHNSEHQSFIEGRCGDIIRNGKKIGFIGEINPKVILGWGLEMPVAALEIELTDFL